MLFVSVVNFLGPRKGPIIKSNELVDEQKLSVIDLRIG